MTEKPVKKLSNVVHAKHDPATALASLFRPITRGRRPGGLEITSKFAGMDLKFMVWKALDTRDQSVLLAVIGMAGIENAELTANASGQRGQQLWLDLNPQENAQSDRAIVVTTSIYNLVHAAGMSDNGQKYRMIDPKTGEKLNIGEIEDCLTRLSMVGCVAEKEGYRWSMNLLSFAQAPDGRLNIALNSRFANAIGGQYVHVSLAERRELHHSEPAQLAHAWLSAWLKHGKTQSISLDKMAEKVWGAKSKNESTNTTRRARIKEALLDISQLSGWNLKIEGRGKKAIATIKRAALIEHSRIA